MSNYQKGILGAFSGLVGTVVGATFRTIEVMRSRPKKSTKAPKASQINQRSKFGLMTNFLGRNKDLIDEGFKPSNLLLSPMNAAVKYNLLNAIIGVAPNFEIDYGKIRIADGKLQAVPNTVLSLDAAGKLVVAWSIDYGNMYTVLEKLIRDKDEARIYIYSEDTGYSMRAGYGITRVSGTLSTRLPSEDAGETMHVWLFFVSADGSKSSTSRYLGSVLSIN